MYFILYVYVPVISSSEVKSLFKILQSTAYSISHLGQKDPPKKWAGSLEEAEKIIFTGTDSTLYTFIRDAKKKLDLTIQIHRDPRWKHSTISISLPEKEALEELGEKLSSGIRNFATLLGQSGAGKSQPWKILHLADDCPSDLKEKFT